MVHGVFDQQRVGSIQSQALAIGMAVAVRGGALHLLVHQPDPLNSQLVGLAKHPVRIGLAVPVGEGIGVSFASLRLHPLFRVVVTP